MIMGSILNSHDPHSQRYEKRYKLCTRVSTAFTSQSRCETSLGRDNNINQVECARLPIYWWSCVKRTVWTEKWMGEDVGSRRCIVTAHFIPRCQARDNYRYVLKVSLACLFSCHLSEQISQRHFILGSPCYRLFFFFNEQ